MPYGRPVKPMSLFLGLNEDVVAPADQPKIKEVRAYVTRASEYGASDVHDTADTHWIMGQPPHHPPITNPMSPFPKYSESRGSWGVANVPSVVVEIEQEDGLVGVGMSTGGEAAAFIIEHHLAMFVEGQVRSCNPYDSTRPHSRTSSPAPACSNVHRTSATYLTCGTRCGAPPSTTGVRGWASTLSPPSTLRCGICSARSRTSPSTTY